MQPSQGNSPQFVTTHWSAVLNAGGEDPERRDAALAELCQTYWYPIYAYVRRQGHKPHDAKDLTQSFFARLLAKNSLKNADSARGKFRSFLLASLKNSMTDEARRSMAEKRGGRVRVISFDAGDAEDRYLQEPVETLTPERIFEQTWVVTLLQGIMDILREEHRLSGKARAFELLESHLTTRGGAATYRELGEQLNMTEEAVKKSVQRLRQRFGFLLRAEIAKTVLRPEDVEEEIRALFSAWS